MNINFFVSTAAHYPTRWKEAFPQAVILSEIPLDLPEGCLLWLHEMLPQQPLARHTRFIVMYDEPTEEKGLTALGKGASGYCNTHSSVELLHTIELAVRTNDGVWVGEALLNRLLHNINHKSQALTQTLAVPEEHPLLQQLNEKEQTIALCVARGESNKEIMAQTGMAERTIKSYLSAVFKKAGVRDRLQLAILLNRH